MTTSFRVRAVNTAVDSDNRIHDNHVAAEYGFQGGLVPGVTVHGYLAAAAIEHFGPEWLHSGAMDVRFLQPYYDGEDVAITITEQEQARIKIESGRASAFAWLHSEIPAHHPAEHPATEPVPASRETMQPGLTLGTLSKTLDLGPPGMSAPLDPWIGPERFAHPAVILALANEILMHNYVLGPWIHSSSEVRNASPARDGEHLQVRGKIVDAYERKGHEFVVLDVAILSGERLVARIEHTAIWKPRKI
jgi:acyl dehydratase